MYMYNSMRTFAIFLAFRETEKEIDSQSGGAWFDTIIITVIQHNKMGIYGLIDKRMNDGGFRPSPWKI